MIQQIAVAISFLTRFPIATAPGVDSAAVAKSMRWFPLVGFLLGAINAGAMILLWPRIPASVVAVVIITIQTVLTGALHLDGLADMADGFGGGRTREDVLRIMRDHAVGAYGATALVLVVLIKAACLMELLQRRQAIPYLFIAPSVSRWSTVLLSRLLPYARRTPAEGVLAEGSVSGHAGRAELIIATMVGVLITLPFGALQAGVCWTAVLLVSACCAVLCRRRIGGVTGDTLGANAEVCEAVQFFAALFVT